MRKQFETQKEEELSKVVASGDEVFLPTKSTTTTTTTTVTTVTTSEETPKPKPKADTPSEVIKPGGNDPKEIGGDKNY